MSEFFKRVEKKYLINKKQYNDFVNEIKDYVIEDYHGKSKICNVYFDTENYDLIRNSLDIPTYKDKIRIRSYNTPENNSPVFIEIKRKSEDVVSKRRIQTSLKNVQYFIQTGNLFCVEDNDNQVLKELQYYFKLYNLKPVSYVSYDRNAYYDKNDFNFRMTIDRNIIARTDDLNLESGSYGYKILEDDLFLLEAKISDKFPLWFVKALSNSNIIPGKFSKYGELYKQLIFKQRVKEGGFNYV